MLDYWKKSLPDRAFLIKSVYAIIFYAGGLSDMQKNKTPFD